MTKKIKTEFPNEVELLRTTLGELKVKLPGLDVFLLANPECTKCSNSKDYQCVPMKGKPGCRTCTSRRISCSRHVQYLVETAASLLEWSVEKTKSMYDKHVKQTRTGRKLVSKAKKPIRKAMDESQTLGSGSVADRTAAGSSKGRRDVAAPEGDYYEGDSESDDQNGAHQAPDDHENFSDELEEDDNQDPDLNESTANTIRHSISKATLRHSLSNTRVVPSISQRNIPPPHTVLGLENSSSSQPGFQDSPPTGSGSGNAVTVQRVDDLTHLIQCDDEHNRGPAGVAGAQSEHVPESSMSPEQRIKHLEDKVAKLNALRRIDATSISRLTKKADTAFDNMSVLLSRVHMHRQALGATVTKHIEPAHQKPFKSLIDKMDETSVSATQILMLLDKRKNYVIPKVKVPVIITDEDGEEWVPWDVVSDDHDSEMEKKREREDGANGTDEGSSTSTKRRKT